MTPTVFIVDDDTAMREALQQFLEVSGLRVETYADGPSFLEAFTADRTGCVVLDMAMPGMDGLAVQAALKTRDTQIPILFLTGHADIQLAVRTVRAGAVEFLEKPVQGAELLERVQRALVLDAERRLTQQPVMEAKQRFEQLSPREREVMALLINGLSNKRIGRELNISPRTVETHRAHVMFKMGANNLADLAQMAAQITD